MKTAYLLVVAAMIGAIAGTICCLLVVKKAVEPDFELRLEKAVNKVLPCTVSLHPQESPVSLFGSIRKLADGGEFRSAAGVAVRKGGYVLTNAHVVAQFKTIYATTRSGKTHAAKVVSSVPDFDVALLMIPEDLPVVEPCQKDKVRVGRIVFSVGTPYELPFSVSLGVISSLNRGRLNFSAYEDFLQTDAAINPGSSGGPLCDLDGKLVGINTAQFSLKSGSNGINFAVPVYLLQPIIDKMIQKRTDIATYLGVSARPENLDDLRKAGLDNARGVVIYKVQKGSPAYKAGVRAGDILVAIDGSEIASPFELRALVLVREPGDTLRFSVIREGKPVEIAVVLSASDPSDPPFLIVPSLEALFEKPDDEVLRVVAAQFGAELARAEFGGLAAKLGLESGDVILTVNGRSFATLAEFSAVVGQAVAGGSLRIRYYCAADKTEKEASREP